MAGNDPIRPPGTEERATEERAAEERAAEERAAEEPAVEEPSAADTFALVGHEIRAEIIRVLGHPDNDAWELSFGDIRRRLTVDAEPSQLYYHLERLLGHFVEKSADGYHLRPAGVHLCRALYAGTFGAQEDTLRVDADFDCHFCSAPVQAVFDTGHVAVVCSDCEHTYTGHLFDCPLDAFADGAAAFAHFRNYVIAKTVSLGQGVCPSCTSQLDPAVHRSDIHPGGVCVHPSCSTCGAEWDLSVLEALFVDPGLIAFCFDHDVDVLSRPWWEHEFAVTDHDVTVRSTVPWEISLVVTLDGGTLELVVDDGLTAIERNRVDERFGRWPSLLERIRTDGQFASGGDTGELAGIPDRTDCLGYLRRHRWPAGITCPHCDGTDVIKDGRTGKDAQRYRCQECGRVFNDLTGTIFSERRFSLPEMFYIVREKDDSGVSRIANQLDRPYNSVLDFVHTIDAALDS